MGYPPLIAGPTIPNGGPRLDAAEGLIAQSPQFVTATVQTVDQMLAGFPAQAQYRGKYIRVSDYGGYVDRVLRCDYFSDIDLYQWGPTLADYGRSITLAGDMTHYALKSPPTVNLLGTVGLGVTRKVTIDLANRRPGEIIELKSSMTGAGGLNILGTGIGTLVATLVGGYQRFVIDSSSGALQLVRLQ